MRVHSRARLIARAAAQTCARPFVWAWRLLRPPVTVEAEWQDATDQQTQSAIRRLEELLARKGHRALGLPTPPTDPRERRRWLVKLAHRVR